MKKTLVIIFLVFVVIQAIRVEQTNEAVSKELEIQAPLEVYSILKSSCYDCHSNEVVWPWYSQVAPFSWIVSSHVNDGRQAVNFSIWENYTEEEKTKHLKDIYRTVYAAMPLKEYMWLHEEANLTKEQRSLVRKWTGVRKTR